MTLAILLVLAYFIGAIPSSIIFGKLFRGIDIREHGSGNAGGTNAWRVLGWKIGLPVMMTDLAKGVIASGLVPWLVRGSVHLELDTVMLLCGVVAVLGHVFPIYIGFRGGKGVATAAGMLIVNAPLAAACALGIFALTLITFGIVSLASMLAAVSLPIAIFTLGWLTGTGQSPFLLALTSVLAVFIVVTHRANIGRLIRGEERAFPKLQLWRRFIQPRQ